MQEDDIHLETTRARCTSYTFLHRVTIFMTPRLTVVLFGSCECPQKAWGTN